MAPDAAAAAAVGDLGPAAGARPAEQRPAGSVAVDEPLLKPACETALRYRMLTLANGLRVLLVHDPETDKAAAALNVRVGSMSDPPGLDGLAHFCEHMLFYSSERYPIEDEYSKFISDHGGHTNAFTSAEDTNYQFDVNIDALPEALDRFAQFFICPLISANGVEREVKAVDSEHGKNLNVDAWRLHQLLKATANQGHPFSRFFTGNLDTLLTQPTAAGVDVRAAVADFHERFYSANLMTAAVYSRHSLDELQALAEAAFAAVPDQRLQPPSFSPDVLCDEHRGVLVRAVPVKDSHTLSIDWDIPPTESVYRAAPTNFLSHLLGHEGAGSAFALLKARGWATALSAGETGVMLSCRSFFGVRVEMTQEGNARAGEVADVVFKYLDLIRAPGGINEEIYNELTGLHRLRFDWRDKLQPYSVTTSLSGAMPHYPDRDLLLALYHVPQEFDAACIRTYLDHLTPQRARVTWSSKTHETQQQQQQPEQQPEQGPLEAALPPPQLGSEPIYGTRYEARPLPAAWLAAWSGGGGALPELHLPATNPFVPTDLSLRPADGPAEGLPQLLLAGPRARAWHRTDLRFAQPKAAIVLDFQSPAAYASPEAAVCVRLLVKLIGDYLNELTYPAELAGLHYSITNHLSGFQVSVSGYSHKLPVLLGLVLERLAGFQVSPERFGVVAEAAEREYRNIAFQQPYQWAMNRADLLLVQKRWRVEQYRQIIGRLTPQSLSDFMPRLLDRVFLEALLLGNLSADEASGIVQGALDKLTAAWGCRALWPGEEKDVRVVKLPAGVTSVLVEAGPNPDNENSAVWVNYQVGPDDLRRNALAALLVQLAKRDAFAQLRTQQQLGYLVWHYASSDQGVQGLGFIIQSDAHPASHLARQVELFVRDTLARIERLPQDEFAAGVEELAKSKLEKPKRLGELASRWWSEVSTGTLQFDRQAAEVAVLRTLTRDELAAFAREVLGHEGGSRRKAVVLIRGSKEQQQPSEQPSERQAASGSACPADGASPAPGACAAPAQPGAADAALGSPGGCSSAGSDLEYACSAVPEGEAFALVQDIAAFKRGCEVWPSAAAWQRGGKQAPALFGRGAAAAAPAAAASQVAAAANSADGEAEGTAAAAKL